MLGYIKKEKLSRSSICLFSQETAQSACYFHLVILRGKQICKHELEPNFCTRTHFAKCDPTLFQPAQLSRALPAHCRPHCDHKSLVFRHQPVHHSCQSYHILNTACILGLDSSQIGFRAFWSVGKLEAQYFVHNMILDFLFNRPRQATNDLHGNNYGSLQVMFIVDKQHKFDILNIFQYLRTHRII